MIDPTTGTQQGPAPGYAGDGMTGRGTQDTPGAQAQEMAATAAGQAKDVTATAGTQVQEVAATAGAQAREVAGVATDATKQVVSTAVEQAAEVGQELKAQTRQLVDDTKHQMHDQAQARTQELADRLRGIGDELRALAEGRPDEATMARDFALQAADHVSEWSQRVTDRGFDGVVTDVQRFARRRPGAFLLGAALAGFGIGRIVRGAQAQQSQQAMPQGSWGSTPTGLGGNGSTPIGTGSGIHGGLGNTSPVGTAGAAIPTLPTTPLDPTPLPPYDQAADDDTMPLPTVTSSPLMGSPAAATGTGGPEGIRQ